MAMSVPKQMPEVHFKDYPIGGKMVTASFDFDAETVLQMKADEREYVRENLAKRLADAIMANKLCEFTQSTDPIRMTTKVIIRAYCAPDAQVKILRSIER